MIVYKWSIKVENIEVRPQTLLVAQQQTKSGLFM